MPCYCEHEAHFDPDDAFPLPKTRHDYCAVPAGSKVAYFVGEICDDCAVNCIPEYVITK